MPSAARVNDITSGHTTYPPQTIIVGSPNVTCNNIPLARVNDMVSIHVNMVLPFDAHASVISVGSSKVTCNNIPVARVGDSIACGGVIILGSNNVDVG